MTGKNRLAWFAICALSLLATGIWFACNQNSRTEPATPLPSSVSAPTGSYTDAPSWDGNVSFDFLSDLENWIAENHPDANLVALMGYDAGKRMRQLGIPEDSFESSHDALANFWDHDAKASMGTEESEMFLDSMRRGYYGEDSGLNEETLGVMSDFMDKHTENDMSGLGSADQMHERYMERVRERREQGEKNDLGPPPAEFLEWRKKDENQKEKSDKESGQGVKSKQQRKPFSPLLFPLAAMPGQEMRNECDPDSEPGNSEWGDCLVANRSQCYRYAQSMAATMGVIAESYCSVRELMGGYCENNSESMACKVAQRLCDSFKWLARKEGDKAYENCMEWSCGPDPCV